MAEAECAGSSSVPPSHEHDTEHDGNRQDQFIGPRAAHLNDAAVPQHPNSAGSGTAPSNVRPPSPQALPPPRFVPENYDFTQRPPVRRPSANRHSRIGLPVDESAAAEFGPKQRQVGNGRCARNSRGATCCCMYGWHHMCYCLGCACLVGVWFACCLPPVLHVADCCERVCAARRAQVTTHMCLVITFNQGLPCKHVLDVCFSAGGACRPLPPGGVCCGTGAAEGNV